MEEIKTILLTGGLGYIGSHIAVELLELNYRVIIVDNLSNCSLDKLGKIQKIVPTNLHINLHFIKMDLLDIDDLDNVFKKYPIDVVIHLAGSKAVGESVEKPIFYYENNIGTTINLIKTMTKYKCYNLIFSSSSTVYGNQKSPYTEQMNTGINMTNPYGKSKYMQEEILKDLAYSNKYWNIVLLRYFNPISHKNELLKEEPNGRPNNLFPYLVQVYEGKLPVLNVFGNDYGTRDGTCIRDFIHVEDLALGHISACEYIFSNTNCGLKIYNLGTGTGQSVMELINAFEKENSTKLNYKFENRRPGDLDISYADCSLANKELGWVAKKTIQQMVKL